MVYISWDWDDGIMSGVIILNEFFNLVLCDASDVFSNSQSWLSHKVISIRSIMDGFQEDLHLVCVTVFWQIFNSFSFCFDLGLVEHRIAQNFIQEQNSLFDICFRCGNLEKGGFSTNFTVEVSS